MKTVYEERVKKVQQQLEQEGVDALIVDDEVNRYYLTGLLTTAGWLIVHREKAVLLVDGRYFEKCQKKSPFSVLLYEKISLSDLLVSDQFSSFQKVGFNSDGSYKNYQSLKEKLGKLREKRELEIVPLDNPVKKLRMIKGPEEIDQLKSAARLGSQGFDFLCTQLKEGVSEEQLAIDLDIFWKQKGSQGVGFDPIIAFGTSSSMPHYSVSSRRLKRGDPILIDIGVKYQHYYSDMTRMLFLGEPEKKMREIYEIVKEAQAKALEICRPGTEIAAIDKVCREWITSKGYGEYFTHSLGHGVGLEIHEAPVVSQKGDDKELLLQPGMVFTVEPGIYLPDIGGVRIEDTIAITEQGHENLTPHTKELIVLKG